MKNVKIIFKNRRISLIKNEFEDNLQTRLVILNL